MGKIIHNAIATFFKLFVPIVYITFILAGLACALVSALIEYQVFSELFKLSNSGTLLLSVSFLLVFAFESTKIFLIFLHKQYSITGNSAYITDKRGFVGLRFMLIFISIVATLIFSFYNLQNPEYDKQLTLSKDDMQLQYQFDLKQLNNSFDTQIAIQIKSVDAAIQKYEQRMKAEQKHLFRDSKEYRGPRYLAAKEAKEKQEQLRIQLINDIDEKRRIAIKQLTLEKGEKLKQAKGDLTTFQNAGNKMLLATLRIVNMSNTFPDVQYVLIVGLISLMLSIGMEFIIWSSFTVLAIHHGDIFDFGIQTQKFKTASEASLDIDKTEAENWVKSAQQKAKIIVNGVRKQSKSTVNNIKDNL
ncbi:conserved membrane protein of unknown function [Tenacibaculum sp. 190524A02b]|uniref:DUF4407 domain-containing protein n=1 Tax=Tenacibaculum vairaonense TaxID=3137860 RepID=A0ABP1FEA2_9FLAO